jgi:hypothetical protein
MSVFLGCDCGIKNITMPNDVRKSGVMILFSYLAAKIESELRVLSKDVREFAQGVCYQYYLGTLPQTRRSYLERRAYLRSIAKFLKRTRKDLRKFAAKIQDVPDNVREAHISSDTPVPILVIAGMAGLAEYFRVGSRTDPGEIVDRCIKVLGETEKRLTREIKFLNDEIPRVGPLWKNQPELSWQKGGFTYLLERLFRTDAGLTVRDAHLRIIEIRRKVDGKKLKFDYVKNYCPAISKARRELPRRYRIICNRIVARVVKVKAPSKR